MLLILWFCKSLLSLFQVHAWCSQKNISGLISEWLDRIMEKDKATRNLVGDQLADLIACDKLSKDDLIEGLIFLFLLIQY